MRAPFLTVVCALAVGGIAVAQSSDPIKDGNDSKSRVDIKSIRATYDRSNDRLVHIVRFHGRISPRNFRNAVQEHGPPGTVCVNIWTTRTPWEASPNYDVCVTGNRARTGLVASVSRLGARGSVRRVGGAAARLDGPTRLFIRFDPDLIRRPAAYRWSAQVTTFERGCTRRGCQDVAPRRGRSVRMRLG